MKESYYIYNNEAIACCAVLLVLKKAKKLSIAKLCLVLPFLLDDRTVSLLSHLEETTTLKELVNNNSSRFSSFNQRFKVLLPVLINSITILYNAKLIEMSQKEIRMSNSDIVLNDFGERLDKISQVSSTFVNMIKEQESTELYKILKIQL